MFRKVVRERAWWVIRVLVREEVMPYNFGQVVHAEHHSSLLCNSEDPEKVGTSENHRFGNDEPRK